jgi:hypothetical protein
MSKLEHLSQSHKPNSAPEVWGNRSAPHQTRHENKHYILFYTYVRDPIHWQSPAATLTYRLKCHPMSGETSH